MNLKVLLPTEILIEQEVTKIVAGAENFLAVNEGILVKCGTQVLVSTFIT